MGNVSSIQPRFRLRSTEVFGKTCQVQSHKRLKRNGGKKRAASPNGITGEHKNYLVKAGHVSADATQQEIDDHLAADGRATAPPDLKRKIGLKRLALLAAQAETAEIDLAEKKHELVESKRAIAAQERNIARARALLDASFRSELPARQGGLPSDKIAAMNCERLDEIYAELSKPITNG